jgi:hypothetical protein
MICGRLALMATCREAELDPSRKASELAWHSQTTYEHCVRAFDDLCGRAWWARAVVGSLRS